MEITVIYLPVFGIMFAVLSVRTLLLRRSLQTAIGDSNNIRLKRAIRVHANFAEYVPLALLLIFFLEQKSGYTLGVHILCLALLLGRFIHAYGVSQPEENFSFRVVGMVLTLTTIISASLRLLFI
jgi:uncharacterized membrane protein YecN with MAPEG domain